MHHQIAMLFSSHWPLIFIIVSYDFHHILFWWLSYFVLAIIIFCFGDHSIFFSIIMTTFIILHETCFYYDDKNWFLKLILKEEKNTLLLKKRSRTLYSILGCKTESKTGRSSHWRWEMSSSIDNWMVAMHTVQHIIHKGQYINTLFLKKN